MQDVERPHAEVILADVVEVERAEIWDAAGVARGELAIKDGRVNWKRRHCGRNGGKARGEVVAALCVDRRTTLALVELDAPAVELYFVEPRVTGWRPATLDGCAGDNKFGATQHRSICRYATGSATFATASSGWSARAMSV